MSAEDERRRTERREQVLRAGFAEKVARAPKVSGDSSYTASRRENEKPGKAAESIAAVLRGEADPHGIAQAARAARDAERADREERIKAAIAAAGRDRRTTAEKVAGVIEHDPANEMVRRPIPDDPRTAAARVMWADRRDMLADPVQRAKVVAQLAEAAKANQQRDAAQDAQPAPAMGTGSDVYL